MTLPSPADRPDTKLAPPNKRAPDTVLVRDRTGRAVRVSAAMGERLVAGGSGEHRRAGSRAYILLRPGVPLPEISRAAVIPDCRRTVVGDLVGHGTGAVSTYAHGRVSRTWRMPCP